jgi:WD40 repeat protein
LVILDAVTGTALITLQGGFEKVFRAVVSHQAPHPVIIFTTWNAHTRKSTIRTYDLVNLDAQGEIGTDTSAAGVDTEGSSAMDVSSAMGTSSPPPSPPPSSPPSPSASETISADELSLGGGALIPHMPLRYRVAFEGDSSDGVTSLVPSTSSRKPCFCSGHYDSVVRVWDLMSCQLLLMLEGHLDWVMSVAMWKGQEPYLVSGSSDGTIKVWDLDNGSLVTTCEGHVRDVWSVTVTPSPRPLIVSASSDRTVRTWDIRSVILDQNWARRKNFCLFLSGSGLISGRGKMVVGVNPHASQGERDDVTAVVQLAHQFKHSAAVSKELSDSDLQAATIMLLTIAVFETISLCGEIAAFL